jgi:hypothetical protein
VTLKDEGTLLTYTVTRIGPSQFADLDGGVRITAQIADCEFDRLAAGLRVRLEFRRIQQDGHAGILCYGHKCVPV